MTDTTYPTSVEYNPSTEGYPADTSYPTPVEYNLADTSYPTVEYNLADTTYPTPVEYNPSSTEGYPADTTYPTFAEYSPATAAYLRILLKPYHDAIAVAESLIDLITWVPQVIPEMAQQINPAIETAANVTEGKLIILQTLGYLLVSENNPTPTPWDIAGYRNDISLRLFGGATNTVPIIVTNGPNSFRHEMTEELAYGIIVGLEQTQWFTLSIDDAVLDEEAFHDKFTNANRPDIVFIALANSKWIYFMTPDFVQGVITSTSTWTQRDPHVVITELYQVTADGNILIDF